MTIADRVEIVTHLTVPQTITVEAMNTDGEGGIEMTTFSGPDAENRAAEYAAWRYQAAYSLEAV